MTENKLSSNSDSTGCPHKLAWEKPDVQKLSVSQGTTTKVHNVLESGTSVGPS